VKEEQERGWGECVRERVDRYIVSAHSSGAELAGGPATGAGVGGLAATVATSCDRDGPVGGISVCASSFGAAPAASPPPPPDAARVTVPVSAAAPRGARAGVAPPALSALSARPCRDVPTIFAETFAELKACAAIILPGNDARPRGHECKCGVRRLNLCAVD
jgi:hypothetical protein